MKLIVKKTPSLRGQLTPPSSKSHSIRAMMFALLANGESILNNVLDSSDTQNALDICQCLGANFQREAHRLTVNTANAYLKPATNQLFTGNSGITTHFILPILGLRQNAVEPITLDCDAQMRARPIHPLVEALRQLGMHIDYLKNEHHLPIVLSGQLRGGTTSVDGTTSQPLSALLISLPLAPNDSEITVEKLRERPYIDMTLQWLNQHRIQCHHERFATSDRFYLRGNQTYHPFTAAIPGDFSSASYFIAAATLTRSRVVLHGLKGEDAQADKQLITLLQKMGADIVMADNHLIIEGGKPLTGMPIDASDFPDLLPTLAVIGTQARHETILYNVAHARTKETDRIHSMTCGLKQMGAAIVEKTDGMVIQQSELRGAAVSGFNDHRTVMALSLAGLLADKVTTVSHPEAIDKTFPHFITEMQSLGANMELSQDE